MSVNAIYVQGGETKTGVCDAEAFEWYAGGRRDGAVLVTPFGEAEPERVFGRQIQYLVHNSIGCTPRGLDWTSRVMSPAENAQRFAEGYLSFLASLRSPAPGVWGRSDPLARCPSCGGVPRKLPACFGLTDADSNRHEPTCPLN